MVEDKMLRKTTFSREAYEFVAEGSCLALAGSPMNRRAMLQLAVMGTAHMIFGRNSLSLTSARRRMACALRSDQLARYATRISSLPAIEIEDWLDPTFPERAAQAVPHIQQALAGYRGRILLSGPFIDLNPGSPEHLIQRATRQRFEECYQFACAIGAREIIFLSSYLPIINLFFYDHGWLTSSIAFWRSYLEGVDRQMTISLCNTFEYHPNLMVKVIEEVGRSNFRLAFDLGHFLVYGREPLTQWLHATAVYVSSVYVHSNDGHVDTHDEPGQGVLTCREVKQVAATVAPDANLILKMNNKDSLERSSAWAEACCAS